MWKNPLVRERIARMICSELNNFVDLKMSLTFLLKKVQELTSCEAVGIRLEEEGDYPYYAYCGFPEGFIRKENSLCSRDGKGKRITDPDGYDYLLECMCGNVIRGRFDPRYEFFTPGGSFWTNSTSHLMATVSDKELQTPTRNYCVACGYESVALIPIQARGEKIGLLQFCDHRPEMLSLELIEFLEMICENTGLAIQNSRIYHNLLLSREAGNRSDESNRQKSAFLASMSHEIRTPLNGIIGMTQLLQDSELREEEMELVDIIAESSSKLLHLLNNILDLSKIEAGKVDLQEDNFDLKGLLRELSMTYMVLARQKGLGFACRVEESVPSELYGDAGKLKEILENLLNNSLKYTDSGSISLTVRPDPDGRDRSRGLVFTVSDTGCGIESEDMAHIFDVFYQTRTIGRSRKGTGLGLPICRQLIEIMGGRIEIESRPGYGSSFSVYLPRARKHVRRKSSAGGVEKTFPGIDFRAAQKKLRVLLVEDDETNQAVMRRFFRNSHIDCDITASGQEALRLVKEFSYDMMFLDISLPDMDGAEVVAAIRKEEVNGKHLPIIAATAFAMEGDRERLLAAGNDDYIAKPVSLKELTQLISKYSGDAVSAGEA